MFYLAMVAAYPGILAAAVPADYLMQRLDMRWLSALFYIVVFGTFVETATALVHALNDRIALGFERRTRAMPQWLRPLIAVTAIVAAILLAVRFGIVDLIARGYGTLTWAFIVIFAVPLCTLGVARLRRLPSNPVRPGHAR
jgi:uncharacterized membrane protein YkvI